MEGNASLPFFISSKCSFSSHPNNQKIYNILHHIQKPFKVCRQTLENAKMKIDMEHFSCYTVFILQQ